MSSDVLNSAILQPVRRVAGRDVLPRFSAGDAVQFQVDDGVVRGTIRGIDAAARRDLPLGLPYRLLVVDAPPNGSYRVGGEITIRSGCLERDGSVPVSPAMFLVAFLREGGTMPTQGALLVQGESLEAASASAMQSLTAELEVDVRERGESPDAMVMLLNAAEVPMLGASPAGGGGAVLSSVTW